MTGEDACHLHVAVDREARSLTLTGNVAALEFIEAACCALANSRRATEDDHFWITHPEEALITMVLDAREDSKLENTLLVDVDETEAVLLVGDRPVLSHFAQRIHALRAGARSGANYSLQRGSLAPESWQLTVAFDPDL